MTLSRRKFLTRSTLLGCSLAASPLITPVSFAAAPWDRRLVVIILRGGMDGLDVLRPYGDPVYGGLRATLGGGPVTNGSNADGLDLDGFFCDAPGTGPFDASVAAAGAWLCECCFNSVPGPAQPF